ncbi:hypothetical protein DER45DRAFT_536422 [Fusarium avenaceum]|nr:hypothetical protein DER45DRAFT_536422 [Fusarium avenaceum]
MHLVMFLYLSQSLAIIVMDRLVTGPLKRERITDRGRIVTATGVGRISLLGLVAFCPRSPSPIAHILVVGFGGVGPTNSKYGYIHDRRWYAVIGTEHGRHMADDAGREAVSLKASYAKAEIRQK